MPAVRRHRGVLALTVLSALAVTGCASSHPSAANRPHDVQEGAEVAIGHDVALPRTAAIRGRGVPAGTAVSAGATVGRAMTGVDRALASPKDAPKTLDGGAVVGPAREALLAQAAEYAENGWTVSGSPKIVRMVVGRHGKELRVRACVDQSAVVVTDAAGAKLPSNTGRTWMVFVLTPAARGWQVSDQTFPKDPDC